MGFTDKYLAHISHIYTNNLLRSGYSGIIITDVADHLGTFYIHVGKHSTNNSTLKKNQTIFPSKTWLTLNKDEIDNTNFSSTVIEEEFPNIAL